MHNAAIRALGLDAVYVALPTPAAKLPAVLDALAAVGGAGNVTVPHKEAVERYVTHKTDVCARAGACNTLWTENGTLVGDNTDVAGIAACVHRIADGAARWLVIGTGGSARAVAIPAAARGAGVLGRPPPGGRARPLADLAGRPGARARA